MFISKFRYDDTMTIDINNVNDIVDVSNDKKENYFKVDYSIRGTAKCKECKKIICKDHLRIGKSVFFRGISFLQYFHLKCAFIIPKSKEVDNYH